jgi:hypothetical protein
MLCSELKQGCLAEGTLADKVRPGALLHSVDLIRRELTENPPAASGAPETPEVIVRRLWDVKADALHVIRSIQAGRLAHLSQ